MKLKSLVSILKGGNIALGQKLSNLLTEDCVILEYTDDAVLFSKDNRLVLANFNHKLTESRLSPDDVTDNELIYISGEDTAYELRNTIKHIIDDLTEGNIVDAEDRLKLFCETYFQYYLLKSNYPAVFTENLVKKSPGFSLRKKAYSLIPKFKSEVFSSVMMSENTSLSISDATSIVENYGPVLFFGKAIVEELVKDSLLNNKELSALVTDTLFETAKTLTELNEDLDSAVKGGYILTEGRFDDEMPEDISSEDYHEGEIHGNDMESDFPVDHEEEPQEFSEFDPSKLTEEEIKALHIDTLKAILSSVEEFVQKKANDSKDSSIPPDMDIKLKEDLKTLEDPEASAEDISQIEARWSPVVSYFLDSDLYSGDMGAEEVKLDDVVSPEKEEEVEPSDHEEESPVMKNKEQEAPQGTSTMAMSQGPEQEEPTGEL